MDDDDEAESEHRGGGALYGGDDEEKDDEVRDVAQRLCELASELDERAARHGTISRLARDLRALAQRLDHAIGDFE